MLGIQIFYKVFIMFLQISLFFTFITLLSGCGSESVARQILKETNNSNSTTTNNSTNTTVVVSTPPSTNSTNPSNTDTNITIPIKENNVTEANSSIDSNNSIDLNNSTGESNISITLPAPLYYTPQKGDTWDFQLVPSIQLHDLSDVYIIDLYNTSQEDIIKIHQQKKHVLCYISAGKYEASRKDSVDFNSSIDYDSINKELNISSSNVINIMKKRMNDAAQRGCDGVVLDDLNQTIGKSDSYAQVLASRAHDLNLSVALKDDKAAINALVNDFDIYIASRCDEKNECSALSKFSDITKPVINIESALRYFDDFNMTKLCNSSYANAIQSIISIPELNGTQEYNCYNYLFQKRGRGFTSKTSYAFKNSADVTLNQILDADYANVKDIIPYFNAGHFNDLSHFLQKAHYVVFTFSKGWSESDYNVETIQKLINRGVIPILVHDYFDFNFNENDLETQKNAYLADIKRFSHFIASLSGLKLVALEPYVNSAKITATPKTLIATLQEALKIVKSENSYTLYSVVMRDSGYRSSTSSYNVCQYSKCSLGDKSSWAEVKKIYDGLSGDIDFIAFEERVASQMRDANTLQMHYYSDAMIGIDDLPQRIDNLATYLKEQFKKPVMLLNLSISSKKFANQMSYDNSSWADKFEKVYSDVNGSDIFALNGAALFSQTSSPLLDTLADAAQYTALVQTKSEGAKLLGGIHFVRDSLNNFFDVKIAHRVAMVDMYVYPLERFSKVDANYYTLENVTADSGRCQALFSDFYKLDKGVESWVSNEYYTLYDELNSSEYEGQDIITSFGANQQGSDSLAVACSSSSLLTQQYLAVLNKTHSEWINSELTADEVVENNTTLKRLISSLKTLQDDFAKRISVTVKANSSGLIKNASYALSYALEEKLKLTSITIKVTDITPSNILHDINATIVKVKNSLNTMGYSRKQKIGLEVEIGEYDDNVTTFTLDSAKQVASLAQEQNLSYIFYNSLTKDKPCSPNSVPLQGSCSKIEQTKYEFLKDFQKFDLLK